MNKNSKKDRENGRTRKTKAGASWGRGRSRPWLEANVSRGGNLGGNPPQLKGSLLLSVACYLKQPLT